jgi:flagellar basal body-associated protein FliL
MTTVHKEKNTGQLADDVNEPKNDKNKVFSKKKRQGRTSWKYRWKRKLFLLFIWGIFIFAGFLSYPLLKNLQVSPVNPTKSRQVSSVMPRVKLFPVQSDRSVNFDSFIIPFEEHGKFTYISLSISFELPNKDLKDEMYKKNTLIRGIIYRILSENIKILTTVSSLEELKELIIHRVNGVLAAGKVSEVIITDFSMV